MFIVALIRYLFGYIEVTAFGGFYDRFLNLAAKEYYPLWGITRKGHRLYFKTYARHYKTLRPIAKQSGVRMKVTKKRGLPFFLFRFRKRKGLFLGIALFFLLLRLFSLFVWTVEIKGNTTTPTQEILDVLADLGLKPCALKHNLDITHIENSAAVKLPSLVWLAVNLKGTCVVVEVRERIMPPEMVPIHRPCNIVASHAGQIISIEAYDGQPVVKKGDAVSEGDLLISGIVEDSKGIVHLRHARGSVIAQTKREITEKVPFRQQKKEPTGKVINRLKIEFFGLNLPLYIGKEPKGEYIEEKSRMRTNINGFKPPIGYTLNRWIEVKTVEYELTPTEATALAKEKITQRLKEESPSADILNMQEEISRNKEGVTVRRTYICKEDIATPREILVNSDDKR